MHRKFAAPTWGIVAAHHCYHDVIVKWAATSEERHTAVRRLTPREHSTDDFRLTARDLHAELRRATRDLHRDIDRHPVLAPLAGSATLPEYQQALVAMYAVTAPVESRVAEYLEARRLPLDYQPRRRMPKLLKDLEFYGLMPPDPVWTGPTITTEGELIGSLYVLEGATRGSRYIFGRLTKTLGVSEERGGRFFSGHGDRSESMWQEFWSFAAEHCPPERWGEACQTAVTVLGSYRVVLNPFQGR